MPPLACSLGDPSPLVRQRALMALSRYGTNARPALPAVLQALQDANTNVHNWASNAVCAITRERLRRGQDP